MRKEILEDLTRLLGIYAPPHHERPVAEYVYNYGEKYLDYRSIDEKNNFIGKKINGNSPRILIDSHIDEIRRRKCNINLSPKIVGDVVEGKGVDNRAGNAAMIELMRRLKDYDKASIFYVGSAKEELEYYTHYKGMKIDPDILHVRKALPDEIDLAIVIDVTPVYENDLKIRIGKGVVLPKKSLPKGLDERMKNIVKTSYELAKELGINYQTSKYHDYYYDLRKTDADAYRKLGIPTLLLSIPAMYMHGKKYKNTKEGVIQEKVDVRDIEDMALFAEKLIKKLYGN